MLRPLPESCWFSKHTNRASVAHDDRSSSIWLLEARRDLVQSRREGKQTFGEGAMRSSSQRCLTSLPWCLDPWIWAAPSLAQSIYCILKDIIPTSPGSVSKLVPCFRLQGAIHSTMGYGSMVRPESPGGTSTWIASFSVHGFVIRSNVVWVSYCNSLYLVTRVSRAKFHRLRHSISVSYKPTVVTVLDKHFRL